VAGFAVTAVLLRHAHGEAAAWWVAAPLLVAGIGGGMVTSPNVTLTVQCVPTRMAGAAGGTLQTGQRIGSAIGTALLATIFYHQLTYTRHAYGPAVSDALLCAAAVMVFALALADLARHRTRPVVGRSSSSSHGPEASMDIKANTSASGGVG
jgi:MFS family permease